MSYSVDTTAQETMRYNLSLLFNNKKIPKHLGRTRSHPLLSWKYALDHFDTLKINIQNPTNIKLYDILSKEFNILINRPNSWVFLSNILQTGFDNHWFREYSLKFSYPENIILIAELANRFCDLHKYKEYANVNVTRTMGLETIGYWNCSIN